MVLDCSRSILISQRLSHNLAHEPGKERDDREMTEALRLMVRVMYAPTYGFDKWSLSPDDGSTHCIIIDDPASFRIYGLIHATITPPKIAFPHLSQKVSELWSKG